MALQKISVNTRSRGKKSRTAVVKKVLQLYFLRVGTSGYFFSLSSWGFIRNLCNISPKTLQIREMSFVTAANCKTRDELCKNASEVYSCTDMQQFLVRKLARKKLSLYSDWLEYLFTFVGYAERRPPRKRN